MPFRCDVFPERERVRIAPAGDLDIATTPRLRAAVKDLLDSGFDHVVVDLADVEFLDSSGVQLLLALQTAADAGEYRFALKPGPSAVQRIFELTGTLDQLPFEAPLRRIRAQR
jgi:anti-sigma B factor antagonist